MASRGAAKRAYNKAFDEAGVLLKLGAKRDEVGIMRMPNGNTVSAYPGAPGRVGILVSNPDLKGTRQKNFPVSAIEDMTAFAMGEATQAEKDGRVRAAAHDLLAVLVELDASLLGDIGTVPMHPSDYVMLRERVRSAIAKARGDAP
jgi:hypothetical protein